MAGGGWLFGAWDSPKGLLALLATLGIVVMGVAWVHSREEAKQQAEVERLAAIRVASAARAKARADSILRFTPVDQVAALSDVNLRSALNLGDSTLNASVWAAAKRESTAREAAQAALLREEAIGRLRSAVDDYTFSDGSHCDRVSTARLTTLFDAHPAWSTTVLSRVACRAVWIGQTAEQLRASWGAPNDVNRTVNAYGKSEQWVYGGGRYIYLDDGVVTSWQD